MVSRQIPTLIAAAAALLAWGAGVGIPTNNARAADCLTAPYFSAPEGSHWYYQTDRATKRKCWVLRAKDQSTRQPSEQAASEEESATRTPASEPPATVLVGVPTSIPSADSAAAQTSPQPAAASAGAKNTARADDCLTVPNSPAPEGRRWFYRTDRATQRKCWYLRAAGEPTQRTNAQAPPAVAPAKKASASDNAIAAAGAPLLIPSPSLKPQPAPMSNATTEDLVAQSVPAGDASPSSRERRATRTGAQAAGPAPAPGSPSPTVATANAAEPNVSASDVRAGSLRPTVDARTRADAESPARGGASSVNAAGMATSLTGTTMQMFLIVALGLGVASLLYRIVTAAGRRRQASTEPLASDGIGDQNPHKWPGDQQQYSVDEDLHRPTISGGNDSEDQQHHRSVDERGQFTDDLRRSTIAAANDRDDQQHYNSVDNRDPFIDGLHRSLMSGADDHDARRPEWPNNARRTGGASQINDDVSKRENTLAQLRRDLDRLLQPNSPEDQQQHRSNADREQLIDDLHRAPISGANDNGSREDDHDAGRRTGGVSHLTDEISERDNRLAQLRRDLDLLLQSPKSA